MITDEGTTSCCLPPMPASARRSTKKGPDASPKTRKNSPGFDPSMASLSSTDPTWNQWATEPHTIVWVSSMTFVVFVTIGLVMTRLFPPHANPEHGAHPSSAKFSEPDERHGLRSDEHIVPHEKASALVFARVDTAASKIQDTAASAPAPKARHKAAYGTFASVEPLLT